METASDNTSPTKHLPTTFSPHTTLLMWGLFNLKHLKHQILRKRHLKAFFVISELNIKPVAATECQNQAEKMTTNSVSHFLSINGCCHLSAEPHLDPIGLRKSLTQSSNKSPPPPHSTHRTVNSRRQGGVDEDEDRHAETEDVRLVEEEEKRNKNNKEEWEKRGWSEGGARGKAEGRQNGCFSIASSP